MLTAYHGIGAYRGQRNPLALSRALTVAMTGVELCASDRPIGAFGAVFGAVDAVAWPQDMWSELDAAGVRVVSEHCGIVPCKVSKQQDLLDFCSKSEANYCELWIRPIVLRALWVAHWANSRTQKTAEIIAKNRGVPLLEITGDCRLWELMAADVLPTTVYKTRNLKCK